MRPLRLTADARSRGRTPSRDLSRPHHLRALPEAFEQLCASIGSERLAARLKVICRIVGVEDGLVLHWGRQSCRRGSGPTSGYWANVFVGDQRTASSMRSTQASSCPGRAAHRAGWRLSPTVTRVACCTSDQCQRPGSAPSSGPRGKPRQDRHPSLIRHRRVGNGLSGFVWVWVITLDPRSSSS